ncbi:MAG: adenylate/guanylate cyclase domain-containing protein [Alphaproteobacteria bacterium]|nr:MAG: adenylate/guanylate cyclase domain-containing protein [Alphaproteobacteria bacterium]
MGMTGRGSLVQRLRLGSGLVLLFYVTLHYVNHMAGHISLAAMEAVLVWQSRVWTSPPGTVLLYGALLTHVVLALAKVLSIRSWRRPLWEWVQIGLGLAIPWLLLSHLTYTRAAEQLLGVRVDYAHELMMLWPDVWVQQSLLLLVVWAHACVGIHFWLRIRDGYARWLPWLVAVAVLVPGLALTGWIVAARREFDALMRLSETLGPEYGPASKRFSEGLLLILRDIERWAQNGALVVIGLALAAMAARWVLQRFSRRVRVTYGDGTVITSAPGTTLLDISRSGGIPHMSVCGGRARCSTCRSLIVDGLENCSPVTEAERNLLKKLNADPDIRLACQARIMGDVQVRPLIQSGSRAAVPRNVDPLGWGVERDAAILFLDIRGFSRISERSLPYDVVFILNSLFGEIGAEIEAAGGYIDKFMGDGLMAIFGLAATPQEASRDAIRAALAAEHAARRSSRVLTHHLSEPIRIGIGIDTGTVVIGRIGRTSDQTSPSRLTAIGDTVNIAARLESATKELGAAMVISARTFAMAGLTEAETYGRTASIKVHNISRPVDVIAIADPAALWQRFGMDAATAAAHAGPGRERRGWRPWAARQAAADAARPRTKNAG